MLDFNQVLKGIFMSNTNQMTDTVLRAQGFSCPSCVDKIEKRLTRLPGVEDATVNYASARIQVRHDTDQISVDDLVQAVAKAGYKSAPSAF